MEVVLPVLTPGEMAEADRRAIAGGTPESVLVDRAGRAVAAAARALLGGSYGRRVVVVCGKGNNGADGIVAAAGAAPAWHRGRRVPARRRLRCGDVRPRARARRPVRRRDVRHRLPRNARRAGRDRRGRARVRPRCPRLAVDIPSGVDGATGEVRGDAVDADTTVCFAALEAGTALRTGPIARRSRACGRHRHRCRRAGDRESRASTISRCRAATRPGTSGRRGSWCSADPPACSARP